jgi:hypothetical protein
MLQRLRCKTVEFEGSGVATLHHLYQSFVKFNASSIVVGDLHENRVVLGFGLEHMVAGFDVVQNFKRLQVNVIINHILAGFQNDQLWLVPIRLRKHDEGGGQ